jgi:hypothetical protein
MQGLSTKELTIKLNTEELTPTQIRLLKSVNSLLTHVLTAEDEAEYFDFSAELLRKTAELIKHAQFANQQTHMNYGEQAVEYAVDFLNENLDKNGAGNIDN